MSDELADILSRLDQAGIPVTEALATATADLPPKAVATLLEGSAVITGDIPPSFVAQAQELDPMFVPRDHLTYLAGRIREALEAVERGESRYIAVSMPPRAGKALALDTPLPTPNGWTTMGAVRVGDRLFDERGVPCTVTAVSETWSDHDCFEVRSDDGCVVVADAEHLWKANLDRRRGTHLYTTRALARRRTKQAMIEVSEPLELPDAELPLDPYVLGAWLGDGESAGSRMTCHPKDAAIMDRIASTGIPVKQVSQIGWSLSPGLRGPRATKVTAILRSLNLLNNKHIPPVYLRSSTAQRLALLQGLVDTDGHVGPRGCVEFTSTNYDIARGVRELVASLGRKVSIKESRAMLYGKDCGPRWRVVFYHAEAAYLPRKRALCRDVLTTKRHRYVTAVQTEPVPVRCIAVDSPSHLFLAGEGMIPTHNTTGLAKYNPLLTLRAHPDWPIMLISHDPILATSWGRWIRRTATKHPLLGITVAPDAGAAGEWETIEGGGVLSRSIGGSIVGRGAKVMVIDDPHKGLADAHSEVSRDRVWGWWLSDAYTRLDRGGHLVIVVATRWHEDDLIGRLTSHEYEGNPTDWEVINFPAIAEDTDVLGRSPGEPLLSPQVPDETPEQALETWEKVREAVGTYAWSASYHGSPAPSKGAIFDADWWRYWTTDPKKVTDDGKVVLFIPEDHPEGKWVDSWDMAFKATSDSDYVVGQRWVRVDANRYLIASVRQRLTFTQTLLALKVWGDIELEGNFTTPVLTPRCNDLVHRRLVEDKANGTTIIDVLKEKIAGMIPINPTTSKEARARAVTPECESGNVLFPLPSDPGNEWVADLLSELRSFPVGLHDDQVDGLSQALTDLRDPGVGSITVPGSRAGERLVDRRITQAARTVRRDLGGMGVRRAGGR